MSNEEGLSSEEAAVYDWRWSQLWDAGYDSRLCERWALRTDLDLRVLVSVKQAGCTDAQALLIFE